MASNRPYDAFFWAQKGLYFHFLTFIVPFFTFKADRWILLNSRLSWIFGLQKLKDGSVWQQKFAKVQKRLFPAGIMAKNNADYSAS